MDGAVVCEQAFLTCPVEVGAVVYCRLVGGRAAEDLGLPGVEVRVEVDDRDGAVGFVDGSEEGEGYGVVATELGMLVVRRWVCRVGQEQWLQWKRGMTLTVMILGRVLPDFEIPGSEAEV